MGKKSGTSWLNLVKRAFRSQSKDHDLQKNSRKRDDHEPEEEEKKMEKRRWLFRKPTIHLQQSEAKTVTAIDATPPMNPVLAAEQRHARAVAVATAAAAEAAVATAQAAVEIVRLTRPNNFARERHAATLIQTAFRGYLARRALRALKGLVKLQALVRGHNVRKQAKLTLKCMQALVRVQDQVRSERSRLSHDWGRKPMLETDFHLWESGHFKDICDRKSISREKSGNGDDWGEGVEAMLQSRKEAALKREKALAYAFSQQIWRRRRNPSAGDEAELEERTKWLDRWMATKQFENSTRASIDKRDAIKTVEIDNSSRPNSYYSPSVRASSHMNYLSPATPSPSKPKSLKVRSASPRLVKEEKYCCSSASHTPNLGSNTYCFRGAMCRSGIPNYMAATESAKAKARSLSAPRTRPSTPERERGIGSAKKRLSYLVPPEPPQHNNCVGTGCSSFSKNLRSPSFKSVQNNGYYGRENLSSYTDSIGGEISPCSTTDLRWLK